MKSGVKQYSDTSQLSLVPTDMQLIMRKFEQIGWRLRGELNFLLNYFLTHIFEPPIYCTRFILEQEKEDEVSVQVLAVNRHKPQYSARVWDLSAGCMPRAHALTEILLKVRPTIPLKFYKNFVDPASTHGALL
jgi:hypothetical protein